MSDGYADSDNDGLRLMAESFTMESPVSPVTGMPYTVVIKDNAIDDKLVGVEFWFKKGDDKRHVGTFYPDLVLPTATTPDVVVGGTFPKGKEGDEALFKWVNVLALIPGCDYLLDFILKRGYFWYDFGGRWLSNDGRDLYFSYKDDCGWSTLVVHVGDATLIREEYSELDYSYQRFKKDELTDVPMGIAPMLRDEIIRTIKDLLSVEHNYGWAEGKFEDALKFDTEGLYALEKGIWLSCQFRGYRAEGSTDTTNLQFNVYNPKYAPKLDEDVEGKPHTCIPVLERLFRINGIRYTVELMKGKLDDGLYHFTRYHIKDNIGSIVFDVGYLIEPVKA